MKTSMSRRKRSLGFIPGLLALVTSLLAFSVGVKLFIPAVFLVFMAVPSAMLAVLLKSLRLGILSIFFAAFAWFSSPAVGLLAFKSDNVFFCLSATGLILAVTLFLYWYRASRA
ncbi:hypothetical protein Maes01_01315 [Microbulbifer aestuariivivens]|uniref:Uncharacterized protein n=1 Tax=Microbulbifer aestuariivivens TaxID=1908308 RepID=A0ABP9WRI9_9GAMM